MTYAYDHVPFPLGHLKIVAGDNGLVALLWENDDPKRVRLSTSGHEPDHPILQQTKHQLAQYFAGQRKEFAIPLNLIGTDFQRRVWHALLEIPYGETRTYAGIAASVGAPSGARATGAAVGRNPISIIAPCHRAVGADGSLTGFAGGLEAKRFLLALEGASRGGLL